MPDGQPVPRSRKAERSLIRRVARVLLDSGCQALLMHRLAHALYRRRVPLLPSVVRRCSITWTGADIHPAARIGRNVSFIHSVGIVIGEGVVVEDEVDIYGGVVLGGSGGRDAPPNEFPTICFDAVLCVGAKVLGPVTVGRHATVAAGAVVLESVPDWALAAGVPATVRRIYEETSP